MHSYAAAPPARTAPAQASTGGKKFCAQCGVKATGGNFCAQCGGSF